MTDREKKEEGASEYERKIEGGRGGGKRGGKCGPGDRKLVLLFRVFLENANLLFRDLKDVSLPTKDISDRSQTFSARYDHEDQVLAATVMAA